jgi:hypothetical protein
MPSRLLYAAYLELAALLVRLEPVPPQHEHTIPRVDDYRLVTIAGFSYP